MKKSFILSLSKLYECKNYIDKRKKRSLQKIEDLQNMPSNIFYKHKINISERIAKEKNFSEICDYLGYICDFAIETAKLYENIPKSKYDDFKQIRIE